MPEKRGVEFHLLANYSFRWQCMQLFPQSLRGPFLLLVIITLLLFAHEAEYSCTKKMQHTKICVSVYIFISFFSGAIKEAYIYAWQKALQHIPHGKGKRSILASSVSGINGAYPQTLEHTFSYASINHFTEVFLLLQFPGNAYLMEYFFACETQLELLAYNLKMSQNTSFSVFSN